MAETRYSAFISYNHRDKGWATWLHRGLERYRLPRAMRGRTTRLGQIGDRLPPVFRDRDELAASGDLAASVRAGLEASATLVVICSPDGARSRWVNEEIRTFIEWGRGDAIRLIIVAGEPNAADPALECMPTALKALPAEPLAADARKRQDGPADARLKIIAGVLGVPFDELRRREAQRRLRRLTLLATAAVAGLVLTTGLAAFAWIARGEAVRQRTIAERRTLTAERTLDFVKSMFRVADPLESKGAEISAREVVDRAAVRLESGLADQPAVRADLGITLAEVYRTMGLLPQSRRMLRQSLAVPHDDRALRVRQFAAAAETHLVLGDPDAALASFRRAATALAAIPDPDPALRARVLVGRGQALSALGDRGGAEAAARQALAIDSARSEGRDIYVPYDLEVLGMIALDAGDSAAARPLFERALAIRLRTEGPMSPAVNDDRNNLASIAFLAGELATAERLFRANLASDERVLGPDHPDLATTLNNIARAALDQRKFASAAPLLERAIAINVKAGRGEHEDMAFLLSNLAIARRHLGDTRAAEPVFERALAIARARRHRTLGPILADLAELRCGTGRARAGLALLPAAAAESVRSYPDDPWRRAWVENTRGACLVHAGERAKGLRALRRSTPAVTARWGPNTLYGGDATRRLANAAAPPA